MAVNIPATAIRQPSDQLNKDASGATGFSAAWKGPYDALETAAKAIKQGDTFEDKTVATLNLSTIPGGWGLLTINFSSTSESSGAGSLEPLSDKWSIKSCRNDVSILAYCGNDTDNPSRAWIESWQHESNAKVAEDGNITLPDGTVANLDDIEQHTATRELIEKIKTGVESVMRFYPMVVRKRVYSDVPDGCLEDLGFVDEPPAPGLNAKKPQGLASVINQYEWLKVQDDADQVDANQWARTEAWMGIKKTNNNQHPWDPDLYGPNRWDMPYRNAGAGPEQNQNGGSST